MKKYIHKIIKIHCDTSIKGIRNGIFKEKYKFCLLEKNSNLLNI